MTLNVIPFGLDCGPANLPDHSLKIERGQNHETKTSSRVRIAVFIAGSTSSL